MSGPYGIPAPEGKLHTPEQLPARYLVLIDSGGDRVARLFLDNRMQVALFDAASAEVASMTSELLPARTAQNPEWDRALEGHSDDERSIADVYTLQI